MVKSREKVLVDQKASKAPPDIQVFRAGVNE